MGKCLKICVFALSSMLVFGCASQNNGQMKPYKQIAERDGHSYEVVLDEGNPNAGKQLVKKARSAIGTPYARGGEEPGGFDCSGLVKWAYNSVGVELPRTAREQSSVGQKIKDIEDMRAGDIVAFRHPRRGYHTGIYVGDGKFIHSPRKRTRVRINSLDDPYFRTTLLGARRVNISDSENLIAQAEGLLEGNSGDKDSLSVPAMNLEKVRAARQDIEKTRKTRVERNSGKSVRTLASNSKKAVREKKEKLRSSKNSDKAVSKSGKKNSAKTSARYSKPVGKQSPAIKKNSSREVSLLQRKSSRTMAKSARRS